MVAIMRDGMGVGLAATQLGILRRVLVFQAGPDTEPTALVNPRGRVALRGGRRRRGGLPQPAAGLDGRRAPPACPGQRARHRGRAGEIEASGLEARVLQHEIDHLDGVLILDRAAASSARARCGRCARAAATARRRGRRRGERRASRASHRRVRTVYLGTSEFAAAVLRRLADSPHRPLLVVTPPDRPQGRGRRAAAARRRGGRGSWGSSCCRPRASTTRTALERIRAVAARGGGRLRLRPADPRAAALRAADAERPPLAAAALARRGADRAGDHGRRRAHRRQHHAGRRRPRLRSGRPARGGARSAPTTTSTSLSATARRARRRAAGRGARPARRGAAGARPSRTRTEATYAEKIEPAERRLDPAAPGRPSWPAPCAR